jgi:hypothetical protein
MDIEKTKEKISKIDMKKILLAMKSKIMDFFGNKYKNMVISGAVMIVVFVMASILFMGPKISLIETYEGNLKTKTYKMQTTMVSDYQKLLVDLKKLSYKYGFFTVREFLPNTPQYKIFVVYFKNSEAFSLSIEPIGDEYVYIYRLGRLDEGGNYVNSDVEGIEFKASEYNKVKDVIVKFLFGRVPVDIESIGN